MIRGLLARAAGADASKTALVYGDERISYGELLERVERCAAGLANCGVGEGDCVAAVLHNCPEFLVSFFASAAVGAVFLPLNPQYKKEELRRFLTAAGPRVIVCGRPPVPNVLEIAARLDGENRVISVGAGAPGAILWDALVSERGRVTPREAYSGSALDLYTSGTTDTCKRVCFTQENLYWEARNFVETAGLTAADTILCTIPLFHSYGIGNCLLDAAYLGATLVLLPPEPDAAGAEPPFAKRCHRVAELFRSEQVRFYPGVPYQFSVLASLPEDFPIDLSGARLFVSSGDTLPARTYERFLGRFGRPIRSLYGSTEAGSIAINTDCDACVEYGSLGPPLRNVALEIRGDGEIWVKSPAACRDGFLGTGDMGHRDHRGHLFLAGRQQSFLKVAGYKVDTLEVEEALASCPGVREAAVVGVEVPRMGVLVKAAVVTGEGCREEEIRAFCRQKLAFYKVPRLIERYDALPRSALGKVLKSELGGVDGYLEAIRGAAAERALRQLAAASPARRRSLVAWLVHAQAAAVLGREAAAVPRDIGFIELGMDSFGSIELHARLEYLFDCELPETFTFDHPTVNAVTESLVDLPTPIERTRTQ